MTLQGAKHDDIGVQAALGVLWFYKNGISPLLPKSCRFIPTCSSYSVEAYSGVWILEGLCAHNMEGAAVQSILQGRL